MGSSVPSKVLIITYYWPPSGGAGVQRWLKFSKYLPESDWEPVILTVDPEFAAYPVTDTSLENDLPATLKVYTTRAINYFKIYKKDRSGIPSAGFAINTDDTLKGKLFRFIRGNLFLPDPRRGWNKYAVKKAIEIIGKERINHIITTSPPHSTQLIGLKIKSKVQGIKWVADLRDPWTDIYYYKQFYPTAISKFIDRQYEKRVLKNADKLITVGTSLKILYSAKSAGIERKTEVITNGYDESDFSDIQAISPSRFTLTYVGTLSDIYPVEGLIAALKMMKAEGKDFMLRFVGSVSDNSRKLFRADIPEASLEFLPYAVHSDAVKFMMNSTLLILIIPSHRSNKSIITGKIFEYIGSGRPVLCLGPEDGEAAEILKSADAGKALNYYDKDSIYNYLIKSEKLSGLSSDRKIIDYTRRNLTKQLSEILNSL